MAPGATIASLGRDALAIGIPRLLHGATLVALNVLAARDLAPADYGRLSIAISVMLLADAVAGASFDVALLAMPSGARTPLWTALERTALTCKLIIVSITTATVTLVAVVIPRSAEQPAMVASTWIAVIAGGAAGLLLQRSVMTHFQLRLAFRAAGRLDMVIVGLRAALLAAAATRGSSALVYAACYAVPPWLTAGAVVADRLRARRAGWFEWTAAAELWRTVPSRVPTFAASAVAGRLDLYALAWWGSPTAAGLYAAALALATVPETVGVYLSPVLNARIVPWIEAGVFRAHFRRLTWGLISAWLPLSVAGAVAAPWVLAHLLPDAYAESFGVAAVLLPGTLLSTAAYLMTMSVLLLYRPRTILAVEVLSLPLLTAALWWQAPRGAMAVAVVVLVARVIKVAMLQWHALRAADQLQSAATR